MYPVIPALALFPFYSYTISMLSFRTGLPQYKNSPPKAQIPAYFQKGLDIKITAGTLTQPLSHSATQPLSHSATQPLRRKGGLCSDKRAASSFIQQHHYFFSSFRSFAGSAYFAVTLRTKPVKNVQNSKYSSINLVPHNYTLQIVHYPLFLALYRRSRQTVWFDSG